MFNRKKYFWDSVTLSFCGLLLSLALIVFRIKLQASAQLDTENSWSLDNLAHQSAIESLFGQVAKTVVYSGATLARLNSRLLCALLRHETNRDNNDQPTLFVFKSQRERDRAFRIYSDDDITRDLIEAAQFDARQATVVFVHGWLGGLQNEIWLREAKNVALGTSDELQLNRLHMDPEAQMLSDQFRPNVIVVDWSEFAQGSLYAATQNSYKVARRLGRILEQLASVGHLRPELMHCLGHSIGAHICGQAARLAFPGLPRPAGQFGWDLARRQRFGRITALDPGGFCYELGIRNETTFDGLRPSDALLVDAYYSNRSPFGNKYQVGQYNIRLNNGFFQAPCSVWRNSTVATEYFRASVRFVLGSVGHNDVLTCDHYFATRFAHQSPPEQCSYVGYACDSYRNFVRGRCATCRSPSQCYSMDFEYQRSSASVEHALSHIRRHSSLLNGPHAQSIFGANHTNLLPGSVPYGQRYSYYMRVANREPYCSYTYRVRVRLNPEIPDLRSFRADSIQLQLVGIVTLKDASNNKLTNGVLHLHGPWRIESDRRHDQYNDPDVDERTLTCMFELTRPERIRSPIVNYDYEQNRGISPRVQVALIESIHFDYLSTQDAKIRAKYSSSFTSEEIEMQYRRQ